MVISHLQSRMDTMEFISKQEDEICKQSDFLNSCTMFYFIVCGIVGSAICIVGISGNLISHKILHKVGRKSVSIFLLKCLSVVDSLYLLAYIFNWSIYSYLLATRDTRLIFSSYEYFHFYVGFPMYTTFLTVSSWMTCFLTIERYLLLPSANNIRGK